jgi:hypothetical protein
VSGHEVAPAVPVVIPVADGLADSNVQIDASRRFHRRGHSFDATVTVRQAHALKGRRFAAVTEWMT